MIGRDKCTLLGTLAKPHGVNGSLVLRGTGLKIQKIKGPVFIAIDGLLVPFFIASLREKITDEFIIDLDDIDTAAKAEQLAGCEVYISTTSLSGKKSHSTEINISGYTVKDQNSDFTGTAIDIMEAGANILLRVERDNAEYLIPFHEDIILKIDHRKKSITVSAPEGLFDL